VNFTGNIAAGVTYNWVNTNAAIGLPASGTGNINPFTATNSTNAAITATITVTPTINSCTGTSTSFDFTIDPSPTVTKPADQTKCNDSATDAVNFTGNITGGVTYNWTNSNIAIGLPASGNGDIASFKAVNSTNTPITATITVTPTADGCPGTSTSFDITVDPTPTVTKPDDQTVCNNAATTEVNFTGNITGGVTYSWTNTNAAIGLATNGMGDVAPFAATNSTDAEISGTIEITPAFNGCQGTPASFTITVNPTPTVIKPADQTLCNDATTEAVNFTGNMTSGVTYNWENSNTAIGLPASGIGNIAVFTAANSTNAAITGTITVTPTANDCPGAPVSFTITVNPTPTVTKPADQTLCNGAMTIAVNFTGDIAGGVTYDWTNGNTDIGLAANGTGNIVSFKAINTEKTVTSATIAVVPTFNGCSGIAVSFTITVNPTPIIDGVTNNARCGTGSIVLNATASGGNINWYTSSTGGNPVHTGTAYSTPDITGTTDYWVEAVQNNCPSATRTKVTASINKLPTIDAGSAPVICEGESVDIHITPTPSSATIIWNDPTVTVNNAAGTFVTVEPPYKNGINHRSTYTYTVTARDGAGCEEDYPVTVMVDEKLKGGITANTPICEGFSATIDARSYNADTYIWTSTDFAGNKQIARIVESPEETAIYNLYIERGVCKAYDVITIEVNSKPVILMIDSIGVRDREIVFAPGYGTQPFKYGVDNQPADGNSVKNNLSFGKHAFYITDGTGCTSDMYDQSVEAPELFPPIYFSPNGDGVKDTWEVEGMREIYPDAVVTIYDRFGKQLTQYKGADTGWDGTYLGKQMPTTDYWYIIYIEIINKQYVGHFTLLRR
jgi:gliding motility-associated-like protein